MAGNPEEKRKQGRKRGSGKSGEHQSERRCDHERQQRQVNGRQQIQVRVAFDPALIQQSKHQPRRHNGNIYQQGKQQSEILSCNELPPVNRLGQERIDGALFQFLVNQTDSDEDGDQRPEDGDGAKPQIYDDLRLVTQRQLAESNGAQDHQQGK